ncbi:MAG: GH39 family glycosyl hydrolase [Promethearchaeota archaeon]
MDPGKKALVLYSMVILLLLLSCSKKNLRQNGDISSSVDLNERIGKISIDYGANEDDNWIDFANDDRTHEFHRQAGSKYIRVWISSPDWRESTIPLSGGRYNFTNLDNFINAVLNSDAIPFIVFAHAPQELSIGRKASNENPPVDLNAFAHYVGSVVTHLKESCKHSYFKKCDLNDWYFEIWNEPWKELWWRDEIPLYVKLYEKTYEKIKEIAPDTKVGGYSLAYYNQYDSIKLRKLLENSKLDFISIHHYGNTIKVNSNESEKMKNVKELFYDSILDLYALIHELAPGREIQIIVSEYNSDFRANYMPHLDEQFTAAWYALSLIWQIKSQKIDLEIFYSGTSNRVNGGFGMWSKKQNNTYNLWPVYYMKRRFIQLNKKGSSIFNTHSNYKFLDMLAVENEEGIFLTIVNKIDKAYTTNIKLHDCGHTYLVNMINAEKFIILNETVEVDLKPYEVKFFKIQ